jgi:hypothetical protein
MLIRPATLDDVQGISQLLAKYYIGRLSDAQKARGFISVEFTAAEIESMVRSPGMVVAVSEDGAVAAVVGSSPVPSEGGDGIFQKIDSLVTQVEYKGRLLSAYRLCLYGPVCVDEAYAGQGLSARLWQGFKEMMRGRYDVGLPFVSLANPASLNAHRDKLGMTQVCEFEVEGRHYALLAFDIPV